MNVGFLVKNNISEYQQKIASTIIGDSRFKVTMAIIDNRPSKSFLQKIKRNLKKGRGGYMVVMFFQHLFGKKELSKSTSDFFDQFSIPCLITENPYSTEIIAKVKENKPEVLVLLSGFGIVKEPWLNLCAYGVISYHHGNMRTYRGMPPALWELYNGEREMGITVQRLNAGLDCGTAIVELTIPILPTDTLKSLKIRAYNSSVNMMHQALLNLLDTSFQPESISIFGKVYTLPNFRQWAILQLKVLYRNVIYLLK
jgi:folate-dependent phosphoribosylglycinamide formyltransferase PurN